MAVRSVLIASMVFAGMALAAAQQAPAARPAAATATGNLNQVMRGIMFPNSNVIFASQDTNPAELKQAADPAATTDPKVSTSSSRARITP